MSIRLIWTFENNFFKKHHTRGPSPDLRIVLSKFILLSTWHISSWRQGSIFHLCLESLIPMKAGIKSPWTKENILFWICMGNTPNEHSRNIWQISLKSRNYFWITGTLFLNFENTLRNSKSCLQETGNISDNYFSFQARNISWNFTPPWIKAHWT